MKKIIRITTVPISLRTLLKGQLKFMSQHYEIVGITSSGKEINDIINDEGIRVIEVDLSRSITPLKDLKSLYKVYKVLMREKPYIVHSHTPKAGTIGMLAAKFAGVPHRLHTIAGLPLLEATGAKRTLLDIVEKITYSCATMIYPNSKGLRDIIIDNRYTKPSKIKVIANGSSNGIDVNYFSIEQLKKTNLIELKKELLIEKDDFVFIFVGRLVTDKGINELIHCFQKIESNKVKLLLVGTFEDELDPLKKETRKEIETNQNIIAVGWKNDVRPYFGISNALVFPSYREGFPNVVLQAGALGLPSIVTDINGCNEIIENRKNGLVIQPKDSDELLDAMKLMLSDKIITQKMAAASREIICSNYKREVIWEALLKEYNSLESE